MGRPKKIQEGENPSVVEGEEKKIENPAIVEEKKEPAKKNEDKIEIKKSDYDKLISQLERNAKDIELLYRASDKSRIAKAMGNNGEVLIKQVRIWTWDNTGKIVIGTNLVTNRSEIILGKWVEDQQVAVVLEDGETFTVPYLEFVRKILNKIPADIVSVTKKYDERNKEINLLKVQLPNGKTLEINSAFVN